MPISTLTSKGQVTIPKAIRERLGLSEGDTLEFSVDNKGRIVARPSPREKGLCGVLRDFAPRRAVTVDEMNAAIRHRAGGKMSAKER